MKNIHFFQIIAGAMLAEEDLAGMAARDPEGHVLSTFGIARVGIYNNPGCGDFMVFVLRSAERDIDRRALRESTDQALGARREELGRDLEVQEGQAIVEAVTASVAQNAQIIHKDQTVIVYHDAGVAAVESSSLDGARRLLRFVARAYLPTDDTANVVTYHAMSHAKVHADNAMKYLLTNIQFLEQQQQLEIGDGCQLKDAESGTIYSVRKGDLYNTDVQALIESGTKTVERLKLVAMEPLEEGQDLEDQDHFAEFSLAADGGLKSVKWSSTVRGMIREAMEAGKEDADARDIVEADVVWRLRAMMFNLLGINFQEAA